MKKHIITISVLVLASFMLVIGAGTENSDTKYRASVLMEVGTGTVLAEHYSSAPFKCEATSAS